MITYVLFFLYELCHWFSQLLSNMVEFCGVISMFTVDQQIQQYCEYIYYCALYKLFFSHFVFHFMFHQSSFVMYLCWFFLYNNQIFKLKKKKKIKHVASLWFVFVKSPDPKQIKYLQQNHPFCFVFFFLVVRFESH